MKVNYVDGEGFNGGVRDGEVWINMREIRETALYLNRPIEEVKEYILAHETSHFELGNRGIVKEKIMVRPNQQRKFLVLFGDNLRQERVAMKHAEKFGISNTMDKLNLVTLRRIKQDGIRQLQQGISIMWTVRE